MNENDQINFQYHKQEARHGLELLKKGRDRIPPACKARLINAVADHIWLALGIYRYTEEYNRHSCRV